MEGRGRLSFLFFYLNEIFRNLVHRWNFFFFFFTWLCVIWWRKETSFYLYKLILRNRVTSLQSICKYIWKFFSLAEFSSCELLFPKQENGGNLLFSTRRGIRNKRGDESKRKLIRPAYIDWVGDRIVSRVSWRRWNPTLLLRVRWTSSGKGSTGKG